MRKITKAKSAGFCFGVEKAVDKVYTEIAKGKKVYTLGPIIHNQEVVKDMHEKGVEVLDGTEHVEELKKSGKSGTLVIRSHGVSKAVHENCMKSGLEVVDATCPYVKKIHRIVEKQAAQGDCVVIIGNPKHPEVEGIRGWGNQDTFAIDDPEEFLHLNLPKDKKLSIVAQTTYNHIKFKEIVDKIVELGYSIKCFNTICNATHERQREAADIAKGVDAMIVIGDKSSSNTGKLVEICKKECDHTIFIQTLADLDKKALENVQSVGITAGASTPKHIIEEVQNNVRS